MRQFITILVILFLTESFGQVKLKEVTEYFPKSKQVKYHFYLIKPEKELKHGEYEVYYMNGRFRERGYFNEGHKIAYLKYGNDGNLTEELQDSVLTKFGYFDNGLLESASSFKSNMKHGTWQSYKLNECDNQILISSTEYLYGKKLISTITTDYRFLGAFSTFRSIITNHNTEKSDTTENFNFCRDIPYPKEARRNNIEGTIFVKIDFTNTCNISYKILNELGFGIDQVVEEYMEIVKKSYSNQITEACRNSTFTIPIKFVMQ